MFWRYNATVQNESPLLYTIKKSKKARRMTIRVNADAGVSVTIPWFLNERRAEKFIQSKKEWIEKKMGYFLAHPVHPLAKKWQEEGLSSRKSFKKYAELSRTLAKERLEYFNAFYGFQYKRIFIKDSKSRWGSCSSRKNLNFNYKIYFLPPDLQDYLIVHELCHLGQFNHSPAFWKLVEKTIPDYKERRRELKKIGI